MDVVKRKIHAIRGETHIDSYPGACTCITITLPLTLSVVDGFLVRIDQTKYILPLNVIEKIHALPHEEIMKSFNNQIALDGERYPFYYLRDVFQTGNHIPHNEYIILVHYEGKQVGLTFDDIEGEHQAVLKTLGKAYKQQEEISGASILGDGTVALVLDTNKLIRKLTSTN